MTHKMNVYSIQRSGHTAILEWLCFNNQPAVIMDNVHPMSHNIPRNAYWYENNQRIVERVHWKFKNKNQENDVLDRWQALKDRIEPIPLQIWSYENQPIQPQSTVIIRNPLNCLASRWKLLFSTSRRSHESVRAELEKYKKLFIEYLTTKEYLIIFDLWYTDEDYRKQICKDLNLNYSENNRNHILSTSSFNNNDVLNRWQEFKDDERFIRQITPEIEDAWNKLLK